MAKNFYLIVNYLIDTAEPLIFYYCLNDTKSLWEKNLTLTVLNRH
jgi:hypothetical protein